MGDDNKQADTASPNSVENPTKEKHQQEEDVPANFFDDFMNEDFIDGLNVVDTWDEDESKKSKPSNQEKDRKISPRKSKSPKRKRPRSKSPRSRRSSERKINSNSSEKDKERDRRDPSKTQRDILRDKDKCAKDQKAKMISEKLRVVETGLVPPGMEMEIDIGKISSTSVANKLQKIRRSVERNRSPDLDRKPRRSTPDRIRRSPLRRSPIRKRSPPRRPRSRSRSRSNRRLSEVRRSIERRIEDRTRRIEERSRRRRSHSRSPRRRRSKTPQSDVSDRERWLRRRSRSRSRSPRRNKSFLQELDDKLKSTDKKIFKELKQTLNPSNKEFIPPPNPIMNPHAGYLPTPVPPPQSFIPQTLIVPPQTEYDQQFFIGQSEMIPSNFPQPIPGPMGFGPPDGGHHMMPLQPMHVPYMMETPLPQPVPMPEFIPINPHPQVQKQSSPILGKDALSKLFNDKKIMLSDYLSLTGKFTDESRPQNIQNKIKVIADCQEVIKELSGEPRNSNRFVVRQTTKPPDKIQEQKHQSPLKKIPLVRFQYTIKSKPSEDKPTMGTLLTKLLHKFGKEFTFEDIPKASPIESTSTQSPPPPTIHETDKPISTTKSSHVMFTQTDRYKCSECEVRNSKIFIHALMQTNETMTFDVACQVGPDDFPKTPTKSILKNNQSLATMTPAQLLANAREESPPKYSKHPYDSPEPKRGRASFSSDNFSDYDDFDRYRSESDRVKGNAMFERDRGPNSMANREFGNVNREFGNVNRELGNVNRDFGNVNREFGNVNREFGNVPRVPPQPFGYQPRPGFNYRPENDGKPPHSQMGYRGRDGRWF